MAYNGVALAESAVLLDGPSAGLTVADEAAMYEAGLPAIDGDFAGKDLLVAGQLSDTDLELFFAEADLMGQVDDGPGRIRLLEDKIIARQFFEASTRTDQSFQAAAVALGAGVIGFGPNDGTSQKKGETPQDTVMTMDQYLGRQALSGLHVIRHPERLLVYQAAELASHPVLNAGNGDGEHVTQGMLDVYTMRQKLGEIAGKTVVFYGDMLKGRTVHSTSQLLAKLGVGKMYFVAPDLLQMPEDMLAKLDGLGAKYELTDDIESVISEADVLYRTRLQLERFTDEALEAMPPMGMVTPELLRRARNDVVIMHPFPEDSRNPDFDPAVRLDERFAVWEQTRMGKIARMAILALTLGRPMSGMTQPERQRIMGV